MRFISMRMEICSSWTDSRQAMKAPFGVNSKLMVIFPHQELIKCRGFQVAPAELEGHLLDHPDVNDVCVVGVQDDYSGEVPLAFVVLTTTAASRAGKASKEAEEIKASIRKVSGSPMAPRSPS